jgi:hypothetical protein
VGHRTDLDVLENEKILASSGKRTPDYVASRLVIIVIDVIINDQGYETNVV